MLNDRIVFFGRVLKLSSLQYKDQEFGGCPGIFISIKRLGYQRAPYRKWATQEPLRRSYKIPCRELILAFREGRCGFA